MIVHVCGIRYVGVVIELCQQTSAESYVPPTGCFVVKHEEIAPSFVN